MTITTIMIIIILITITHKREKKTSQIYMSILFVHIFSRHLLRGRNGAMLHPGGWQQIHRRRELLVHGGRRARQGAHVLGPVAARSPGKPGLGTLGVGHGSRELGTGWEMKIVGNLELSLEKCGKNGWNLRSIGLLDLWFVTSWSFRSGNCDSVRQNEQTWSNTWKSGFNQTKLVVKWLRKWKYGLQQRTKTW